MKKRHFLAAALALPFAIFTSSCEKKDTSATASATETDGATTSSEGGPATQPLRFPQSLT